MAFDQDGRLYVADSATNAIHRYDSQGNYLDDLVVGAASSLQVPVGIIFDAQGRCWSAAETRTRSAATTAA